MKLGIILNTNDPETAWNALRLGNEALAKGNEALAKGNEALAKGNETTMFLLGKGVEIQKIPGKPFDVAQLLNKFLNAGGKILACGTCLAVRNQEAGICSISTMSQLVEVIAESDKVVTLG